MVVVDEALLCIKNAGPDTIRPRSKSWLCHYHILMGKSFSPLVFPSVKGKS